MARPQPPSCFSARSCARSVTLRAPLVAPVAALTLVLAALLNVSLAPRAHADFSNVTTPATGSFIPGSSSYDYGPSIIQSGSLQRIWWCGYGDDPNGGQTDTMYYTTYDTSTNTYGPTQQVFHVALTGNWDSRYVCDPSVIAGTFNADGQTYSLAMYYTGTDADPCYNNRIGVAFSNDGVNWTRYSGNPIIYPNTSPTCDYGAGQPATYSYNGQAGIVVFYLDTTGPSGSTMYYRRASDGVHFGSASAVSTNGLSVTQSVTGFGGDVAYDSATNYWYLAQDGPGFRSGDREAYEVALFRTHDLNNGPWEPLGFINTNLNRRYLNLQPGLVRDQYGNVTPWLPSVTLLFGAGANDSTTWDLDRVTWNPSPSTAPFQRYYNNGSASHWVSTGYVSPGYGFEQTLGYLYLTPHGAATQALYGCVGGSSQDGSDHFISTHNDCEGQFPLGVNGWLYPSPPSDVATVPLYRCYTGHDHFVSTRADCEGTTVESLLGYAPTSPQS